MKLTASTILVYTVNHVVPNYPVMTIRHPPARLRDDCVREAEAIIAESGVESLSLREVARRLGVSHQAPYKHFPSRDHLLAEIVSRAFEDFAAHLDARARSDDPHEDLTAMGRAYLGYAATNPLRYRLIFGSPLPDAQEHPEMMRTARHAFSLLCGGLARMAPGSGSGTPPDLADIERDAMFVWACVHGLASITQASAMAKLGLAEGVVPSVPEHTLWRIGAALLAPQTHPDNGETP